MLVELEIVEQLCRGIDPRTGLPLNTPKCPLTDTVRLRLLSRLKKLNKGERNKKPEKSERDSDASTSPPNKGKKWLDDDLANVKSQWESGLTLEHLSKAFGRSEGAICYALAKILDEKHEKIISDNVLRGGNYNRHYLFKS